MQRRGVALLALALAACGIKGAPPQPKDPSTVSDLRVEGRDGTIRISFRGRPAGDVTAFDVLRRLEQKDGRAYFEKVATLAPEGTRRYAFYDRGLAAGGKYVYRVRPRRDDPDPSELRFSGPQGTFTWTEPPAAPTDVKSAPLNAGARLSWDVVPEADGYRIYQLSPDKTAKLEPVNRGLIDKTSYVVVALADGKSVCYVVRAVKLPEKIAEAREANAEILSPSDHVEAPTGAEVGDAAQQGLVIPRGNVAKEVEREVSELVGEGASLGVESASSDATCVTPGLTELPPPPKHLKTAILDDGVSLTWKKSPGEDVIGYHVERKHVKADGSPADPESPYFQRITTSAPEPKNGFTDRTVVKGEHYIYQVRSVDSSLAEGQPSTPTKILQFKP